MVGLVLRSVIVIGFGIVWDRARNNVKVRIKLAGLELRFGYN